MKRIVFIFLLLTSVASAQTFPDDWGRSVLIVLKDSVIDANQTDFTFPLVYNDTVRTLPSEMFDASSPNASKNDGGDIRITTDSAGTTQIAREIVEFDTVNNIAVVHIKKPSVTSSGDDSIWVWYDQATATEPAEDATYGKEAVWSTYEMVLHLEEDGSGSAPQFIDGTAQDHDSYGYQLESADQVAGKIGLGQGLDRISGAGNQEAIIDSVGLSANGKLFTIETWLFLRDGWGQSGIFSENSVTNLWSGTGNSLNILLDLLTGSTGFRLYTTHDDAGHGSVTSGSKPDTITWYHVVATADDDSLILYVNGVGVDLDDISARNGLNNDGKPVVLGQYQWVDNGDYTVYATMDEMRFSDITRDSDEVSALYKTQNNPAGFAIVGTPYDVPVAGAYQGSVIMIGGG